MIFCQALTGALCTLAEQLLAALRSRFNNAGEYQEDGMETSRKWLEQISVIGVLLHFQSTLSPHLVRFTMGLWEHRKDGFYDVCHALSYSLKFPPCCGSCHQKEERTMLEDTKAALPDLDKVTVFFRQLEDECLVASKRHEQNQTLPIQVPLQQMGSCMVWLTLDNDIVANEDLLFSSFSGKWLQRESGVKKEPLRCTL